MTKVSFLHAPLGAASSVNNSHPEFPSSIVDEGAGIPGLWPSSASLRVTWKLPACSLSLENGIITLKDVARAKKILCMCTHTHTHTRPITRRLSSDRFSLVPCGSLFFLFLRSQRWTMERGWSQDVSILKYLDKLKDSTCPGWENEI